MANTCLVLPERTELASEAVSEASTQALAHGDAIEDVDRRVWRAALGSLEIARAVRSTSKLRTFNDVGCSHTVLLKPAGSL